MRFARLTACAVALACLATSAKAQQLPADATQALAEYAAKRADLMRRADAELAKQKQALLKKMQKVQQAAAGNPDASKQVQDLITKINGPAFTTFEIEAILKNNATTINSATAQSLARAYSFRQMTEDQWLSLPAIAVDVHCNTISDPLLEATAGDVFVVCPHPTLKWRHRKKDDWSDYKTSAFAVLGKGSGKAISQSEGFTMLAQSIIVTAAAPGQLRVGCLISDQIVQGEPEGFISFKIFRVQDR